MAHNAYLDVGAGMAEDYWTAAWTFELAHWGMCGQGPDEASAVADLARGCHIDPADFEIVERRDRRATGDETIFQRDLVPATGAEKRATLDILAAVRTRTLQLVRGASTVVLDWHDPDRRLPAYASWYTAREVAWHIADTESRYYLPVLGLPTRPRAGDLLTELTDSAVHVHNVVAAMPSDLRTDHARHGSWTSTKMLRRLAWHERGELVVLQGLVTHARQQPR